jgi:hypothetical protein
MDQAAVRRVLAAALVVGMALPCAAVAQAAERPTPNELAIFSSAVKRNVLPWLEQQPGYAGVWLDREEGELVVSLTEPDPAVIAGLDARTPGGRDGWRLEMTGTTWQELKAATRKAWRVGSKLPGVGRLESSWIDAQENRVGLRFERGAIEYRDVPAAERAWQEELGVPVHVWREEIAPSERLAGMWTKLPEAPWGAAEAVSVAVDGDMLVLDRPTGRVLRYDPAARTWERGARAPQGFDPHSPSVWTGTELIVLDQAEPARIFAYDPAQDGWRRLAPSPLRGADIAVWADGHVIIADVEREDDVDIERSLAALDLDTGEWRELPAPTAPSQLVDLHRTGSALLAVTSDEYEDIVEVSVLDPEREIWSEPVTGPLSWWYQGSVVIGDRLVFAGDGEWGPSDATFDAVTRTWTSEDYQCPVDTRDAFWTGELLVSESSRYSLDPATGACYRFPGAARTQNSNAVVWTGDRVIYWSGGGAEEGQPDPYRKGGHAFVFAPDEEEG